MSVTYYSANRNLDKNFGATNFTAPTTFKIGLSTADPTIDGSGAVEPSGNNYARVTIDNNKTTWSTASNGTLSNNISVQFPESTGSWGVISYVLIYDASDNLWFYEALTTSRTVSTATTVLFAVGGIFVSMTNA